MSAMTSRSQHGAKRRPGQSPAPTRLSAIAAATMLIGLAPVAASAQPVPLPMEKPAADQPARPMLPSDHEAPAPAPLPASTCLQELVAAGVTARRAAGFVSEGQCIVEEPVVVEAVATRIDAVALPARPVLECRFAATLAGWLREVVAPAAAALMGSPADALITGPGHQCRDRAAGRLSEHAIGNAVDVVSVRLADGRSLRIESLPAAEGAEREFLQAISASACGYFTTVLGPGSDAAHADHLHIDLALRRTPEYRICMAR